MTENKLPERNPVDVAGHLKDAWLHVMGGSVMGGSVPHPAGASVEVTLTDEVFARMAAYLFEKLFSSESDYKAAYYCILDAVNRALDIRDESGCRLRDYHFDMLSFMKTLQADLLTGISHAETYIF